MVLLTSSSVSVIASSGMVCLFTFLLFLSGYVLQQQTVRSIQEALRVPPEPKPVPTLPPQFQAVENETTGVILAHPGDSHLANSIQVPVIASTGQQKPTLERLAYIFALEEPLHLCSALLFAKQQRAASRLSRKASIVLLYPSTWESDSSVQFTSALNFMRDVQELYDVIYHPVQIHNAWNTRSLLLGELQWGRWDYDQSLYLRSPGMVLDSQMLDGVLSSADTTQSWTPLNPSSGENPEALLKTSRGLQSPKGATRKQLVSAPPSKGETRAVENNAAYVTFDDGTAEDEEYPAWYADLQRELHAGMAAVCDGSGLLQKYPG